MAHISVEGQDLVVGIEGTDKLWTFRSHLTVPLAHVARIRHDPAEVRASEWKGFKAAGARIPGHLAAGTFHQSGGWVFWDVHDPDSTVIVELHDERYSRLVVEVDDPGAVIARVEAALSSGSGSAAPPAG